MRDGMFHTTLEKKDGKLGHLNSAETALFNEFVKSIPENQLLDVFFDLVKDDGSIAQLAKVHKCIRTIASETGEDFENMKLVIKQRAGLCVHKHLEGEDFLVCKSFGRCSKEDLALAIQTCIELGDKVGVNLR